METAKARRVAALLTGPQAANVAICILAVAAVYLFVGRDMRFFLVPSASMEPTLYENDQLVTLNSDEYQRGDIVVIRDRSRGEYIVKRIMGVGGDRVTVNDHALIINGQYVSEPYIKEPIDYVFPPPGFAVVPEGRLFVLGDNRNESDDSSQRLETYPVEDVIGKVRYIYFPYDRIGKVRHYPPHIEAPRPQ